MKHRSKIRFKAIHLLPVLLFAAGLGIATAAQSGAADEGQTSPLSSTPGLGRDQASAVRDDTIALYQTYLAEVETEQCMRRGGFRYEKQLNFPPEFAASVARNIGVADLDNARANRRGGAQNANPRSGAEENDRYVAALDRSQRDRYYLLLHGESAADIESVRETGLLPPGRSEFANRGCSGEARSQHLTLFSIRSEVNESARQARESLRAAEIPTCDNLELTIESFEERYDELLETAGVSAVENCGAQLFSKLNDISLRADTIAHGKFEDELNAHAEQHRHLEQAARNDRKFQQFVESEMAAVATEEVEQD